MRRGRHLQAHTPTCGEINNLGDNDPPLVRQISTKDWWTKLEDIPVHGDDIKEKSSSCFRFYFENVDGLRIKRKRPAHNNNSKLQFFNTLLSRLDVDIFGGAESRTCWSLLPSSLAISRVLDLRDGSRAIAAHNEHESFSPSQQGGTFLAATEQLQDHIPSSGKDPSGLGRWCWMTLVGQNITTRVIVAYEACTSRKQAHSATIAQQRRYWRIHNDNRCPRRIFREQLCQALQGWRDAGEQLVLLLDSNENMTNGALSRMLQHENLQMEDAVKIRSGYDGPNTFIRGSRQIDGAWVTPGLDVQSACFLPFFLGIGDHRGILLDISKASLIGGTSRSIARPSTRRLRCNREGIWIRYNNRLETYCRHHRLQSKINRLAANCNRTIDGTSGGLEAIDAALTDGMKNAEKHCRKLRVGEVPFSGVLASAGLLVSLWGLIIRHHAGHNINTRRIRRMENKCNLTQSLSTSSATARIRKIAAEDKYAKLKRGATRLRREFLREKAEQAPTVKAQKEIRLIMRHEDTRRAWRIVNSSRGKKRLKGVSAIEIRNNDEYITVEDKTGVEDAIMHNNSARFHLTTTTPCMQAPVVSVLGYLSNTNTAQDIINDEYLVNPQLDDYTLKFFSFIGAREAATTFSAAIEASDFTGFWKSSRECTSSSMSGRHYGHYKAAAKRPFLSTLHSSFLNICSQCGISIKRWHKGLTVMLEKCAGNIKVEKLRAILLMEADFNFINKLMFGHRLMKQVMSKCRLPVEIYGGISNRSAQEVAVNRRLTLDLFRLKRRRGAIAGVDATQCYDRIVHSLVILLSRNEGAPLPPLLMMFGAIQAMQYYLRTTFGDSESHYGGTQEIPFQGSCQGNGASPAMWIMISMYLVLLMHKENHVSKFTTAFTGATLQFLGFLFVDDTDLVILGEPGENTAQVISRLQQMVTFWNGILRVSGGALKPEKCYWYFADFTWVNGKATLNQENPEDIFIVDDTDELHAITYKSPDEATEAVGVWQDLLGTSTKQREEIIRKVRAVHTAMATKHLPRDLVWIALKQAIWKSIDFVLPATTFTESDCATIAKELYRPMLPRLGCNRNYPLLLRYNPSSLMGLGLYNPYWEQGFAHIEMLLTHGGLSTITGHLLAATFEQHQLAIGVLEPLFSLPYIDYGYLTDHSWITCAWQFLDDTGIRMLNADQAHLRPLRENDAAIMTLLRQFHHLSKQEITAINRVRNYLEVLTVADIATGDGKHICTNYLSGIRSHNRSSYEWQTEHPCAQDFRCWRKYIPSLLNPLNSLRQPLGRWLAPPHRVWIWFYCPQSDRVFQKVNTQWKVYCRSAYATRTNAIYVTSGALINDAPELEFTTVIELTASSVQFEGTSPCNWDTVRPLSVLTPKHHFWVLTNSDIATHSRNLWLLNGLQKGTLLAVCDGSYQPDLIGDGMSASWVIESQCRRHQTKGSSCISNKYADPYRGELLGIYMILSAIYFIEMNNAPLGNTSLRIGCDNEKSGYMTMINDEKVPSTKMHMDILKAIRRLKVKLKTTVEVYHLYGHQDDKTEYSNLPRDAQLNVNVDIEAKAALQEAHCHNSFATNAVFPAEGWQVWAGDRKLQGRFRHELRYYLGKINLRKYLYHSHAISWNTFPLLDLTPLDDYVSSQSQPFRLWFSKHWSNFCGIGTMMKRMNLWETDLCPCCRCVPESSTTHLFLCPHPPIAKIRESEFKAILTWLQTIHTDPYLLQAITALWFGRDPEFEADDPQELRAMWDTMVDIGPQSMWLGLLPIGMVDFQHAYYRSIGESKTGSKWGEQLVGKMLRVTLNLWLARNDIVHVQTKEGMKGMNMVELKAEVTREVDKGVDDMMGEDFFLMDTPLDRLLREPIETIRGWLCSVKIARGDIDAARAEGLRDRGELSHEQPTLTEAQLSEFLDWRNIHLNG